MNDGGLFMFDRKQFAAAMNRPYYPPKGFNQTMEIGIGVPTKYDVDREYERLTAIGVQSLSGEPVTQPWG